MAISFSAVSAIEGVPAAGVVVASVAASWLVLVLAPMPGAGIGVVDLKVVSLSAMV